MGIAGAIGYALQLIVMVVSYFVERATKKKEAKIKYYEFVRKLSTDHKSLAGLKLEVEAQIKKLKEEK